MKAEPIKVTMENFNEYYLCDNCIQKSKEYEEFRIHNLCKSCRIRISKKFSEEYTKEFLIDYCDSRVDPDNKDLWYFVCDVYDEQVSKFYQGDIYVQMIQFVKRCTLDIRLVPLSIENSDERIRRFIELSLSNVIDKVTPIITYEKINTGKLTKSAK
jgi:hypothetical protein